MNWLIKNFLRGLVIVVPIALTIYLIYAATRDLLDALVGDKKRFDQPVSVRVTDEVRTLGFVTQDDLSLLAMPGHVAVYLPFSYSMAGTVIVVPRGRVEKLSIASSSLMAFVVSGGVSSS